MRKQNRVTRVTGVEAEINLLSAVFLFYTSLTRPHLSLPAETKQTLLDHRSKEPESLKAGAVGSEHDEMKKERPDL